jgi:beta-N-acetylhexosaminidase
VLVPPSATLAFSTPGVTPPAPSPTPVSLTPAVEITLEVEPTVAGSPAPPTPDPRLAALLAQMSLEQKIGQMLMPSIGRSYNQVDEPTALLVSQYHVGGLWLTSRNFGNAAQAQYLIAGLNQVQAAHLPGLPLLLSIDHEGGMVFRFPYAPGMTAFPSSMALGATGDAALAYQVGLAQALELRAVGFNLNLAPVLDVNSNPLNPVIGIRSFGSDPLLVADLGVNYWRGLQAGGMMAAAKHFPGHGGVAVDSHSALPVVTDDLASLEAVDVFPFRRAIQEGLPAIMVGHLLVPALDPDWPASLSPLVIDGYLRDELGFEGVVVSDDVLMRGLGRFRPVGEIAVRAVLAGADLLPLNTLEPLTDTAQVRDGLLAAVHAGRISSERIDESVRRILRLKLAGGLLDPPLPFVVDAAANAALARQVADQSLTLLWDSPPDNLLPLEPGARLLVINPSDGLLLYSESAAQRTAVGRALAEVGFEVQELLYSARSFEAQSEVRSLVLSSAAHYDAVVLGTWDAAIEQMGSSAWQQDLVPELLARNPRLILLALRTPYDLKLFPEVPVGLAVYGAVPAQADALAAVLSGQQSANGHLPVPLAEVIAP